jgi:hypothetical protein
MSAILQNSLPLSRTQGILSEVSIQVSIRSLYESTSPSEFSTSNPSSIPVGTTMRYIMVVSSNGSSL